eukprot:g15794.t1
MAYTMDMQGDTPGLVVRNTFLEYSGRDWSRAFSDISDNKLPWKVPISSGADSAGLFQISRKRIASEQEDLFMSGLDFSAMEENPATIPQEAGSRVPPQFPNLLNFSPCSSLMPQLGYGLPDVGNPWLFGSGLSPTCANLPPWNLSMFPPTPPSLAAAAALWKEQGIRHGSLKKETSEVRAKKKVPEKKGQKDGASLPVGVQAKADKVPQPEPLGDPTTVMLRHIPNRYTSAQLVELLDAKGFQALTVSFWMS